MPHRLALVLCLLFAASPTAQAQAPTDVASIDVRLLRAVYASPPAVASVWRAADWTAYKVFIGAPAAAWGGVLLGQVDAAPALRLTAAQGIAMVSYYGLKNVVRRERPYRVVDGIASRRSHGTEVLESVVDPFSFPSGHAAVAFAVATTAALEYRRWEVAAPALVWATSVATSRVWLGVHYPSDILVGALLGAGIGTAVHVLWREVAPVSLRDAAPPGESAPPMVHLRLVW